MRSHFGKLRPTKIRRFAAINYIRYLRSANLARDSSKLINADGRLYKSGISSGFEECISSFDRLIEAFYRSDIGSCNNLQVGILPCIHRSADFVEHLANRDNLFSSEMSAFFRKDLILDLDACCTCPLECADGPDNVEGIAETGIGVGDDRDRHPLARRATISATSVIVVSPMSGIPSSILAIPAPVT